jgi:cytidine deaminase
LGGAAAVTDDELELVAAARAAAGGAYAPYSGFPVGAALRFADGAVVSGCNVENASYGLALCAETVAVAKAMAEGRRDGLLAIALTGPEDRGGSEPITPCGRCRQVLHELAALGGTDPDVLCVGPTEVRRIKLSALLPAAFGPASLG